MFKNMYKRCTLGFTTVEVLVVIFILFLIVASSASVFKNIYRDAALRSSSNTVYSTLTNARASTLSSQNALVYGVHVATSSITRFVGSVYDSNTTTNKTYVMDGGVTATSALISNGTNILFAKITGDSTASGTLYLRNDIGTATTTIQIYSSGLIEYK